MRVASPVERRRLRLVAAGLSETVVLATLWLRQPEAPTMPLVAGAVALLGVLMIVAAVPRLERLADWSVGTLSPIAVALLVAGTGGAESNYQAFYLLVMIVVAAMWGTRRLLVEAGLVVVLFSLPFAYDPSAASTGYTSRFLIEFVIGALITLMAHFQAQRMRQATDELTSSERRFRRLAESLPHGAYVLRLAPDRAFEFVNPGMEVATGFSPADYYANPDLALERVHPDDRERFEQLREDPDGLDGPIEVRWRDAAGEWRWIAPMAVAVRNAGGELIAVQGTVRDITDQKRIQAALQAALDKERAAADRLRAVDQMKQAFLQALSHELRTPLTSLVGYSMTIKRFRGQLSEEQLHDLADRMVAASHRLSELVEDLLDVDRMARGVLDIDRHEVDLGALVRDVATQLPPNGQQVVVHDSAVRARVDPGKVHRIVENLLANAYRHTPDGTRIGIRIGEDSDSAILVVEDDGPGIPDELKPRVFQPFQQGDAASQAPSPGTGVGLALVAGFAQLHGGTAWVEDRPGGGARFCVRLPRGLPPTAFGNPMPLQHAGQTA